MNLSRLLAPAAALVFVAASIAVTGCQPAHFVTTPLEETYDLTVTPSFVGDSGRQLLANNFVKADIHHVDFELFRQDATLVSVPPVVTVVGPNGGTSKLGNGVTFTNLRKDKAYVVKAKAYNTAGSGSQISDDLLSKTDITAQSAPGQLSIVLAVRLIDVVFTGSARDNTGVDDGVTDGGYTDPGSAEGIAVDP